MLHDTVCKLLCWGWAVPGHTPVAVRMYRLRLTEHPEVSIQVKYMTLKIKADGPWSLARSWEE